MSFIINSEQAYQKYSELKLRKATKKSATLETVSAILSEFRVQVNSEPADKVRTIEI